MQFSEDNKNYTAVSSDFRTVCNPRNIDPTNNFLQRIIDSLPGEVMVIAPDHSVILVNKEIEVSANNERYSLLKCHQISHGKDKPCQHCDYTCSLKEVLKSKTTVVTEHVHHNKVGKPCPVEVTASPVFDDNGEITHIVRLSRDITERKKRELDLELFRRYERGLALCSKDLLSGDGDSLTRALEKLRAGAEVGGLYVFQKFLDSYESLSVRRTHESAAAEISPAVNKRVLSQFSFEKLGLKRWTDYFQQGAHLSGLVEDFPESERHFFEDQGLQSVLILPIMVDEEWYGFIGFYEPYQKRYWTEQELNYSRLGSELIGNYFGRKKALDSLKKSEERYRLAFTTNMAIKLIIDPTNGKIIESNPAAQKYYGYSKAEMMAKTISDINTMSLEEIKFEMEATRISLKKSFSFRHQLSSGEIRDVEVYSSLLPFNDKDYLYSIIHDVTDRKLAEREQKRLEAQLFQAQKMEAIGQLAGGIAHDFNNILQVIHGSSELALLRIDQNNAAYPFLEQINKAGNRATALIKQLLAFSRQQVLAMETIDLNVVVKDSVQMLHRIIGSHIQLVVDLEDNLPAINADPGQITQILMNLCLNARDAMPNGGEIKIHTRYDYPVAKSNNPSRHEEKVSFVTLQVIDDGIGMDDEISRQIFEPFFTTKEVGKGTGLGLATVYSLVKQHQGYIKMQSTAGLGSTFSIHLPATNGDVATNQSNERLRISGGDETILLVEDDENVLQLSKEMLDMAGYTVLVANNGLEAIRKFRLFHDKIDMVILDVIMPKLGGRAVFEQLRVLRPKLPILFSSGYSGDALHTNFILDEGLMLIEKPFETSVLLKKVRNILDQSGRN